jgi:hypothetical protein
MQYFIQQHKDEVEVKVFHNTGKRESDAKYNTQHVVILVSLLMAKKARNYIIDHQ